MQRHYELGERNPDTLPGRHRDSEPAGMNISKTVYWRSLRKKVASGRLIGTKYI